METDDQICTLENHELNFETQSPYFIWFSRFNYKFWVRHFMTEWHIVPNHFSLSPLLIIVNENVIHDLEIILSLCSGAIKTERNNSVIQRWATGWVIDGSNPGRGWKFFFSPPRPSSGAHPASYLMGTRGSFPGVKATGAWSWPLDSI
jgi:hypothetical protein